MRGLLGLMLAIPLAVGCGDEYKDDDWGDGWGDDTGSEAPVNADSGDGGSADEDAAADADVDADDTGESDADDTGESDADDTGESDADDTGDALSPGGACSVDYDLGSAVGEAIFESTTHGESDDLTGVCALYDWTDGHDGRDVLLSWSPPESATFCFRIGGDMYDPVLYLVTSDCSSTTFCDDDSADDWQSEFSATTTAGTELYIVVDESRATGGGDFDLSILPGSCE
jgi:hypothetical protein